MNKATCKLLYELSEDSRMTTKELGKKLRISQQGASYLIRSNTQSKLIKGYRTVFDPSRFGLSNIYVFYNFRDFRKTKINEIINYLGKADIVTHIENLLEGGDLLVEYSVPNLSFFNKFHEEFLYTFNKELVATSIYPVIVKHIYPRNYLASKKTYSEIIISGDRIAEKFSDREAAIIDLLSKNPKAAITDMSSVTGFSPKTIIGIKKGLERKEIIRKYTIGLDTQKAGILKYLILLSISLEDKANIGKFISYCMTHPNITSAVKIIGSYNIIISIEKLDAKPDILSEMRKNFDILDYKVIKAADEVKSISLPNSIPKR